MRRVLSWCVVLVMAGSCVRNPVSGKKQLSLISESQEVQLGQQSAEEVRQSIGLYADPKAQAYVSALGQRLVQGSERPKLPWSFQVVDDSSVNAFALPGGPIFITRGILTHLNSEAELAAVMGHEIGHITAKHSVSQLSKAQLAQIGLGVGSVVSPTIAQMGQVAAAGLQLLFLKYGRDAETQSDTLGFKYMTAQGYDPREMRDVFITLGRVGESAGDGGRLPEWLSSHPNPENRLGKTDERIKALGRDLTGTKVGREEYLAVINGMVFGDDPRQGFFRGSTFFHPSLKLRVQFPEGWKTANSPQAVMGVSPKQDAMVGLATAGKDTPEQAAQKFLSQEGVRAVSAGKTELNGLPAVASYFEAQTQDGVLGGLVAFVSHEGATFQLLGYTAAANLRAADPLFRSFIGSFAKESDPSVLNVQPARVELVKLDRAMSVADFNQRYPSSIPIAQLALINGVEEGGTLEAGRTVKRVVGGPATR